MFTTDDHPFYVIGRGSSAGVYRTKAEAKAKLATTGEAAKIKAFTNYEAARLYLLRVCEDPAVRNRYLLYEHPNAARLRELFALLSPQEIVSLDTEMAPLPETHFAAITQFSLVDASYHAAYDEYFKINRTSLNPTIQYRKLIEKERSRIQEILSHAKIIIGYQLNSDLTVLAQNKIICPIHAVYLDLNKTYEGYRRYKTLAMDNRPLHLKDVADQMNLIPEDEVTHFHNSLYDALVTMRLFNALAADPVCQFYQLYDPTLYQPDYDVSSDGRNLTSSPESLERLNGTIQILENGIVQAFVTDESGTIIELRLTPREYRLYRLNRTYNPGYSLLTFYRTVALPKSIHQAEATLRPQNLSPFPGIHDIEKR